MKTTRYLKCVELDNQVYAIYNQKEEKILKKNIKQLRKYSILVNDNIKM